MNSIDSERLNQVVHTNIETLCKHFFHAGHKVGNEWRIGNVNGDKGDSLGIQLTGSKAGLWHDRATGEGGTFIELLMKSRGVGFPEAVELVERALGISLSTTQETSRSTKPFGNMRWNQCVLRMTPDKRTELCTYRGYSPAFIDWLVDQRLIGIFKDKNGIDRWAFPVQHEGNVAAIHCEVPGGERKVWFYHPRLADLGLKLAPFVLGNLTAATEVHVHESQWDLLAEADTLAFDEENQGIALVATLGSSNGALAGVVNELSSEIYLWPQRDVAGENGKIPAKQWLAGVRTTLQRPAHVCWIPDLGAGQDFDFNDWRRRKKVAPDDVAEIMRGAELISPPEQDQNGAQGFLDNAQEEPKTEEEPRVYIEFLTPSQIKAYQPPPGTLLVGDNHIVRGSVFIIGGAPGVGKSRCTIALAEAGATRLDWLGQKVHVNFKTIVIQNENGRYRLKLEFAELDEKVLDQYLRISPPPPFGLCFDKLAFREQLKRQIDLIEPGVIVIDPWNAVPRDDKAKDYREAFDLVRDVIPAGDAAPSIGIAAHTRKPLPNERTSGRALLNLLAGSHVLMSVPRAVWILQHASDDVAETRVVVTCCKNNDGELGPRSVWVRDNGLWTPYQGFDWDEWDNPDPNKNVKVISERTMQEVFDNGNKALRLSEACAALMKLTGKKKSVCYAALDQKGPFADSLEFDRKSRLLRWIPDIT